MVKVMANGVLKAMTNKLDRYWCGRKNIKENSQFNNKDYITTLQPYNNELH